MSICQYNKLKFHSCESYEDAYTATYNGARQYV